LRLFDAHRVGVYAYTYEQGLRLEPPAEDGRRCLDAEEMYSRGWEKDERGRWFDPVAVERARQGFAQNRPSAVCETSESPSWDSDEEEAT